MYDGPPYGHIQGYLSGAVLTTSTAGDTLAAMIAVAAGQILRVAAVASSSGTTPTIIDVRKNQVSMYHDLAQRPTLAGGQTGKFTSHPPTSSAVNAGDVISLVLVQTGGHGGVVATAALEEP